MLPSMSTAPSARSVDRAALFEQVWAEPLAQVAARLGLSPNGLAKLCDRLLIPRPSRNHWFKDAAQRAAGKPALPPAPDGSSESVTPGGGAPLRRARTRLSLDERRTQLMNAAADLTLAEGVAAVSMKRLARDLGISEAQAHNCFARRLDLLLSLARREIAQLEANRKGSVARGTSVTINVALSTITYLHQAQARGPLLQALLMVPEVRDGLRAERRRLARATREPIVQSMASRYGITPAQAFGSNAILSAICLRAGGLLASGKTDLAVAERLCLSIVLAGSEASARLGADGFSPAAAAR